jgi:hypothetical protein
MHEYEKDDGVSLCACVCRVFVRFHKRIVKNTQLMWCVGKKGFWRLFLIIAVPFFGLLIGWSIETQGWLDGIVLTAQRFLFSVLGINISDSFVFGVLAFLFALSLTVCFRLSVCRQYIHNARSWVFYYTGGVIGLSLYYVVMVFIDRSLVGVDVTEPDWMLFVSGCFLLVLLLSLLRWEKCCKEMRVCEQNQFGANTVGLKEDAMDYRKTARAHAYSIKQRLQKNSGEHVVVYSISADTGEGKSSFARMVVEALCEKDSGKKGVQRVTKEEWRGDRDVLYTYISLTEANHATDVSKLFEERWKKALATRYPMMSRAHAHLLSVVMREMGNGSLMRVVSDVFPHIPLEKTQSVVNKTECNVVQKDVARTVGFVPRIQEQCAVVLIDEIERGLPEEIFRIIETIERFRHTYMYTAPVKVVFLMCVNKNELKKMLEKAGDCPYALQAQGFFDENHKVVEEMFFPVLGKEKRHAFVVMALQGVREKLQNVQHTLPFDVAVQDIKMYERSDPLRDMLLLDKYKSNEEEGEEEAMSRIVTHIATEMNLREIKRLFDSFAHEVMRYQHTSGVVDEDVQRVSLKKQPFLCSEWLLLLYVQYKHPTLYGEVRKKIEIFVNESFSYILFSATSLPSQQGLSEEKKQEIVLRKIFGEGAFLEKILHKDTEEHKLLRRIAPYMFEDEKKQIKETIQNSYIAWRYFSVDFRSTDNIEKFRNMYIQHKESIENKEVFGELVTCDDEDLRLYGRFVSREIDHRKENIPHKVYEDIARAWIQQNRAMSDDGAAHAFREFAIYTLAFEHKKVETAVQLIVEALQKEHLTTTEKLSIIQTVFEYSEGEPLRTVLKEKHLGVLCGVFTEYQQRYEQENSPSIYEKEQRPDIVLHRVLDADDPIDIEKKRAIALRSIQTEKALAFWWRFLKVEHSFYEKTSIQQVERYEREIGRMASTFSGTIISLSKLLEETKKYLENQENNSSSAPFTQDYEFWRDAYVYVQEKKPELLQYMSLLEKIEQPVWCKEVRVLCNKMMSFNTE